MTSYWLNRFAWTGLRGLARATERNRSETRKPRHDPTTPAFYEPPPRRSQLSVRWVVVGIVIGAVFNSEAGPLAVAMFAIVLWVRFINRRK